MRQANLVRNRRNRPVVRRRGFKPGEGTVIRRPHLTFNSALVGGSEREAPIWARPDQMIQAPDWTTLYEDAKARKPKVAVKFAMPVSRYAAPTCSTMIHAKP
ncbi:hypothetical protein JX265_007734 [Neoarthrinium moseri]|uniref:Uncharacterized protein n=1 Tax=Neoarthrinium moseri TaxID=1658444 RepID=A0A9P9WJ99_9PEZI|nr:hypothetical protein JX265_007734 [Neoarthrinium moseri]